MKKIPFVLLLFLFCAAIFFLMASNKLLNFSFWQVNRKTPVKIAACPTCLTLAQKLDSSKYQVIPTDSTQKSLELLHQGFIEMFIAGRTLLPQEPELDYRIIQKGYSLLSSQTAIIHQSDLSRYPLFTDLDPEKIKTLFLVHHVAVVDDVYSFLNQGVVITSWENTDHARAEMIHLLNSNGRRVPLSRQPTLYCLEKCNDHVFQDLLDIVDERKN